MNNIKESVRTEKKIKENVLSSESIHEQRINVS